MTTCPPAWLKDIPTFPPSASHSGCETPPSLPPSTPSSKSSFPLPSALSSSSLTVVAGCAGFFPSAPPPLSYPDMPRMIREPRERLKGRSRGDAHILPCYMNCTTTTTTTSNGNNKATRHIPNTINSKVSHKTSLHTLLVYTFPTHFHNFHNLASHTTSLSTLIPLPLPAKAISPSPLYSFSLHPLFYHPLPPSPRSLQIANSDGLISVITDR